MGGRKSSARAVSAIAVVLITLAAAAAPAVGQTRPDYRSADPRALIQALKTAPREERSAVAAAMVARRAEVLPALRMAARSGDAAEKILACSMIADMRDRDGVEAVVAATSDPEVKVRRRAATALRILADRRAAARLRELVRSETDLGVLKTSLAALGRLGLQRDVDLIVGFLAHSDAGVRVVAAAALAMLGDQRGLDLVIAATDSAADPGVQKSATYALGFFASAAAGDRLQAIVDDPRGAWKSYALIAQAERQLAAQSRSARIASLDALAHGRSRTLSEWAVERLTDIGGADAAAVLRKVGDRPTPVGAMAQRRLRLLEAQP
jgi:HEAT repeat protein